MSSKKPLKPLPELKTDEDAEQFVQDADLSEYDLSGFKPAQFEFQKKDAQINMRIPQPLLDAIKVRARLRGVPYQRYIREVLQHALEEDKQ